MKYHLTETGPKICKATIRPCPIGGQHFDSLLLARKSHENTISSGYLPTATFSKNNKGFKEGTTVYNNVVIVHAQRVRDGKFDTVYVVAPDIKRLTNPKRLELARKVWALTGKSVAAWDSYPEESRLSWSRIHMGSGEKTSITLKDGLVDWTTDTMSAGAPLDNVLLIENDKVSV